MKTRQNLAGQMARVGGRLFLLLKTNQGIRFKAKSSGRLVSLTYTRLVFRELETVLEIMSLSMPLYCMYEWLSIIEVELLYYGVCALKNLRELSNSLPKSLNQFTFPAVICESNSFTTSSPILDMISLINFLQNIYKHFGQKCHLTDFKKIHV